MLSYSKNGRRYSREELLRRRDNRSTHSIPRAGTLDHISYCVKCGTGFDDCGDRTCSSKR